MTICRRSVVMIWALSAVVGGLAGTGGAWFVLRPKDNKPPPVEVPKTTAELLVGKWKFVKSNTNQPAELRAPIEFTRNGAVLVGIENVAKGTSETRGRYRLVGNTLWIFLEPPAEQGLGGLPVTIESVTEDRLVAIAWAGEHERHSYEYERVSGDAAR